MHDNHRHLIFAFALLTIALVNGSPARAQASLTYINAAYYSAGTDLSIAFPGVALSDTTHSLGEGSDFDSAPLLVTSTNGGGGVTLNTLGSGSGTYGNINGFAGDGLFAPDSEWSAVHAVFSQSVDAVTIGGFTLDGDPIWIFAYGTDGSLIGKSAPVTETCVPAINEPNGCGGFAMVTTFTSTTPVGSIFVTSDDATSYVTSIQAVHVPEPSTLADFAAAALILGFSVMRRRRRAS